MLTAIEGLVTELREVGVPVSTTEAIDAARCLRHVDVGQRHEVRSALAATLVKTAQHRATFNTLFDLFFAPPPVSAGQPDHDEAAWAGPPEEPAHAPGGWGAGGRDRLDLLSDEALRELVVRVLADDDELTLLPLAAQLVDRFANLVPGQPVAGTFAVFRTLRAAHPVDLRERLSASDESAATAPGADLRQRLRGEEADRRVERLRQAIEAEVRRRLVADRGADAVARSLRSALPEDVDFLTASTHEIESLEELLRPLPQQLAAAVTRRRRHSSHRHIDFRRTIRASMSTGGVPVEPNFRPPHPPKPELIVIADISGSVATFARFTLALTHAMRGTFRSVRSFVFVDGMDEVTDLLADSTDIAQAAERIDAAGAGVLLDGRSDYGNALRTFHQRWGTQVNTRSIVIILGDARSNYRHASPESLSAITGRAAATYWLNPERAVAWDSGDSVMSQYAPLVDAVFECRNVRQLRDVIQSLA
ncbi:VWA domain-containing protein [Janibacter sp. G1551]|uniref:VWA domain-containing protein n=1 Tax=Janibacter sp. G1551 TaxID=3420440 RepID=UPI003CFDDB2A